MLMLGNSNNGKVAPLYWRSGVIRKVCVSPKAAETRALLRLMDDAVHMAKQLSQLLNEGIKTRLYTYSRPLLESLGSSGQIEEKALRQTVAYLKQGLEDEEVLAYSWIPGEEIVAHVMTKQGSTREALEEIMVKNNFEHMNTGFNMVTFEDDEFKIRNLVTKREKGVKTSSQISRNN